MPAERNNPDRMERARLNVGVMMPPESFLGGRPAWARSQSRGGEGVNGYHRHCERSEAIHPSADTDAWIASVAAAPRNDGGGIRSRRRLETPQRARLVVVE